MKAIAATVLGTLIAITAFAAFREGPNPPKSEYGPNHRFVFYAVLEGCYEDGLTSEDIDLIIPQGENGKRVMMVNLVYSCPLCHPAFEAFRLYGSRQPFHGQKITAYDTFGVGLSDEIKRQLRGTPLERRTAIQSLISKWVAARADLLRLDERERKRRHLGFQAMKKKGMNALKKFQAAGPDDYYGKFYEDWKACPICEGAEGSPMGID